MMKNPRNLLIFAVLGGIVGVGIGLVGTLFVTQMAQVDADIKMKTAPLAMQDVLQAQQDAWNAGDIEGFMQGYLKSDQLRFASGGNITFGWDETLSGYLNRYDNRAKMGTLEFDIKSATVIDDDDGLIFGKWTLIREDDEPNGLFTLHMKKGDDGWKVVSDHTSSAQD